MQMLPHAALQHYFKYPAFRPGQEEALNHVLAGRDALVVMPTGSGKSLIYQLAGLLLPGSTVVFSPLVSLMKDQVDSMVRRDIPATFINSSLDLAEQNRRLRDYAAGKYKIVLVAPERLRSANFQAAIASNPISLMVIDEAHCLSQWGHDFRPDYLRIADARREWKPAVTLALTATATPRAQGDIVDLLGLQDATQLILGFNRPNLTLEVIPTPDQATRLQRLRDLLKTVEGEEKNGGIIYTTTRKDAEEVAAFVRDRCGLQAQHYHAALDPVTRARVQDLFLAGDLPIVVATNAFGMGIDRPDVRFVIHYGMPGSLEAYYQEAGRGGRDGLPARATLLYSSRDAMLHEHFIENESPEYADLTKVHALQTQDNEISSEVIAQRTGLKEGKARVAAELIALSKQQGNFAEGGLRALANQMEGRRQHKRMLLRKMVEYAQTEGCRRRLMLDYFGDTGPADAPVCCDNCLAKEAPASTQTLRAAETQAERAALIVLDTVALLKARGQELGKGKLAQVLKGSASEDVARYLQNNRNAAKFAALRLTEIESLITQLIAAQYLRAAGAERPTLQLSTLGAMALKARAAIDVTLSPVRPEKIAVAQKQREVGGTVLVTKELLQQGLPPEHIAAERGLTLGTIYAHCAQIIAEGSVSVERVVPKDVLAQIRAAIQHVGAADALSPIKAMLPDDIDYGVIRCVAEDWKRTHQNEPVQSEPLSAQEEALFEQLRAWRMERARAGNVPPYVVFHDRTLEAMVRIKPSTNEELLAVPGVGPAKVERYGAEVLRMLTGETSSSHSEAA